MLRRTGNETTGREHIMLQRAGNETTGREHNHRNVPDCSYTYKVWSLVIGAPLRLVIPISV